MLDQLDNNWKERRQLLLKDFHIYDRLQPLLDGAKANTISLAVFKPTRIVDFIWEECERDWDAAKVAVMRQSASQGISLKMKPGGRPSG